MQDEFDVLTDDEFLAYHNDRYAELPTDIVNKSISVLREFIPEDEKEMIREMIKSDRARWSSPYHFGWGMLIRNILRQNVCLDAELPSKNWDDYYVFLVEIALNMRMYS